MEGTICADLETVELWDNHDPYLYHAYVELKAEDGSLAEVIPYDIGFRRIEIIDKSNLSEWKTTCYHRSKPS